MSEKSEQEQVRQHLSDLDAEIAELRRNNDDLKAQVGGHGFGAEDSEDTAAALTNIEENEAVLASLEQRREKLRARSDGE